MLIKPQTFDIFLYGSGKVAHNNFWAEKGPFYSSRHPMANRIIIASQSVGVFKTSLAIWADLHSNRLYSKILMQFSFHERLGAQTSCHGICLTQFQLQTERFQKPFTVKNISA